MADPIRPLRLGTVVWFGSLEFMSLGCEYDMILLTPRAPPAGDDVTHRQPGRRRCVGHRSRHARQARRERDYSDATRARRCAPHSADIPCLAVGTESLAGDPSSLSLGRGKTPVARSDVPSSSSALPLPEESTQVERSPTVAPSPYLFGLKNIAAAYAFAYASAHAEPLEHHQ